MAHGALPGSVFKGESVIDTSAEMASFTGRVESGNSDDPASVEGSLPFQDGDELGVTEVGDLPAPEPFHGIQVQVLYTENAYRVCLSTYSLLLVCPSIPDMDGKPSNLSFRSDFRLNKKEVSRLSLPDGSRVVGVAAPGA